MRTITLTAADISCEHCKKTIEGGFAERPGFHTVAVDVPTREVHVTYDEAVIDETAVKAELDALGYPADATV